MGELLNQLRRQFDTVLPDTPPVGAVADATLLATMADGLLLGGEIVAGPPTNRPRSRC